MKRTSVGALALVVLLANGCSGSESAAPSSRVDPQQNTDSRAEQTDPEVPNVGEGSVKAPSATIALARVASMALPPAFDLSSATARRGVAVTQISVPQVIGERTVLDGGAVFIVEGDDEPQLSNGTVLDYSDLTRRNAEPTSDVEFAQVISNEFGPVELVERTNRWLVDGATLLPVIEAKVRSVGSRSGSWLVIWDEVTRSILISQALQTEFVGREGCEPNGASEICVFLPDPMNVRTVPSESVRAPGVLVGESAWVVEGPESGAQDWLIAEGRQPRSYKIGAETDLDRAAANAYYWITRTNDFLSEAGWGPVRSDPVVVVAFDASIELGAHYTSIGEYIAFGHSRQGTSRSAAEDAHVVVHEHAHALFDAATRGFLTHESGVYNESNADIVAVLMLAPDIDGPADCFAQWFQVNDCLRPIESDHKYPDELDTNDKYEPRFWTGAIWDIYEYEVNRRGGDARKCSENQDACRKASAAVLSVLVDSWVRLPSRFFTFAHAATAFESSSTSLRSVDVDHVRTVMKDRKFYNAEGVSEYLRFVYEDERTAGYELELRAERDGQKCVALSTAPIHPGFAFEQPRTFGGALTRCLSFRPGSAQWFLEFDSGPDTQEGVLVETRLELGDGIVHLSRCRHDLGARKTIQVAPVPLQCAVPAEALPEQVPVEIRTPAPPTAGDTAEYCAVLIEEQQRISARLFPEDDSEDYTLENWLESFEFLRQNLGDELRTYFRRLEDVAPRELVPELALIRESVDNNAWSLLVVLSGLGDLGRAGSRLGSYSLEHCGRNF